MKCKFLKVAAFALAALAVVPRAHAATATTNLSVSATVVNNCSISAAPLDFGNYDPIGTHSPTGADLVSSAQLVVACTVGDTYSVYLGQGANAGTGSTDAAPVRQLGSGTNKLAYQLYQDSARTIPWGNTAASSPAAVVATSSSAVNLTVYGVVAKGQSRPAGTYTDTVVATINF